MLREFHNMYILVNFKTVSRAKEEITSKNKAKAAQVEPATPAVSQMNLTEYHPTTKGEDGKEQGKNYTPP